MKHTIKNGIQTIGVLAAAAVFLLRAPSAANGVAAALRLCGTAIIPSMLPFLVITSYISTAGILSALGKPADRVSRFLFRLPGEALGIVLMSMIGGFPVGEKMTADALQAGTLTQNQAKRMAVFCIGGGPAFIVNTVGLFLLGSRKAGVILLASSCLGQLTTGVLTRFFAKEEPQNAERPRPSASGHALVHAVADAGQVLLTVCGWVLVFGAVSQIITDSALPQEAKLWLTMLLEVTNGCAAAAARFPLPITAFVLCFAGLSVHAQILPFLESTGLPYRQFFAVRVFSAALSAVISAGLLRVFPCEVQTLAQTTEALPVAYSVSLPASAGLLLMFALIILDLAAGEKV